MPDWKKTKQYHQYSKHDHYRSAPGPGYMDWENQPDPFRRYNGAEIIKLKKIPLDEGPLFYEVLKQKEISALPLNFSTLSQLFFDSLAISAWKSFQGSRWALRVNPSSGNLHPTEGYLICGPLEGINSSPSVSHYDPKTHGLEIRTTFSNQTWKTMSEGFPENTFFIGLSSIYWREAWKYGLRAFRYCHHDMGHAIAAINIASSVLGWRTQMMDHLCGEDLEIILGLHKKNEEEMEVPYCLMAVTPQERNTKNKDFVAGFSDLKWLGDPNILSHDHMDWHGITEVSQATQKPHTEDFPNPDFKWETQPNLEDSFPIRKAIHQRRSAVAMDGKTRISSETFYQFMATTICPIPFQRFSWEPQIHLGLFVHRVDGLSEGLYFLVRNKNHLSDLKTKLKKDFAWAKPNDCPKNLDLFLLQEGDFRGIATSVSCGQEIAGKGCFSLGMISAFENVSLNYGPWMYPRLYWECGAIGQMLYLQAEVSGILSTGIGCFFDDSVHQVFGIEDRSYQSLYHFTVGGPVEDTRLTTLPAYEED